MTLATRRLATSTSQHRIRSKNYGYAQQRSEKVHTETRSRLDVNTSIANVSNYEVCVMEVEVIMRLPFAM